jgi:hypothetical protein
MQAMGVHEMRSGVRARMRGNWRRRPRQLEENLSHMKLTIHRRIGFTSWLCACLAWVLLNARAAAPGFTTTTVQGTVYLAGGQPASGTLQLSWPAFTTANDRAVAAGRTTVSIGADGYVSVNLAPNQGSTPAGLFYTAVYHLNDGTTSTEYRLIQPAQLLRVLNRLVH